MSPSAPLVERLDEYVRYTLLGTKPDTAMDPLFSLMDPSNGRIRMTLFYYDQPELNATGLTMYKAVMNESRRLALS